MKTRRTSLMRLTALAVSIASAHALWAEATADASGHTPTLSVTFNEKSLANTGSMDVKNQSSVDASNFGFGYYGYGIDTGALGSGITLHQNNSARQGDLSGTTTGSGSDNPCETGKPIAFSTVAKIGTTRNALVFYARYYTDGAGFLVCTDSTGKKLIGYWMQGKATWTYTNGNTLLDSTDGVDFSEWHHYVIAADSAGNVVVYVDGESKKTIASTDFKDNNGNNRNVAGKSYSALVIGAHALSKTYTTPSVVYDDFRVYAGANTTDTENNVSYALTASEVQELYTSLSGNKSVAFNDTQATFSTSISDALTDATSGDTVTVVADGRVTDTSASVPNGVTLNIEGSTLPSDFALTTGDGSAITTDSAVAVGAITVNGATTLSGSLTMTGNISGSGKLTLSGATLYNTASKTYTITAPLEIAADTENTIDCGASGKQSCRVTINSAMTGSGTLYCKSRSSWSCVNFQTVPSDFTGKVYGWANNSYSPIRFLKDNVSGMSGDNKTWDMSKSSWNICADQCGESTESTACTSTDNNGIANAATGLTFKFGALDAKMAVGANTFEVGSNNGNSSITGNWSAAELKKDGTGTLTLGDGSKFKGISIRSGGGTVVVASTIQAVNYFSSETGTTLEIPFSSESASVQMTGTSSAYAPTLKGTVNITASGDISAGTYDLITWQSSGTLSDTPSTWTLNGDSLPTGYTVSSDTENKKFTLKVASSDVTVDGITVTADWINDKGLSTVASENNTTVDALLAADSTIKATNGYNYFACYALGLEPDDENSTPKVSIEQGANGTFTVSLSGVKLAGGVAIDLKLLSTTDVTGTFAEKTAEVTTSGSGKDETFTFDATSVTGCEFFKLQIGISAASAASGE